MKNIKIITLFVIFAVLSSACSDKKTEQRKDRSVGGTSEILFVTQNDEQWDGQMGQTVRDFFEQEQYGLPQPEKNFKVAHINANALNDMFKKHRNLIIAEIVPDLTKPIIESQNDWMAAPQYAIKIKAKDSDSWIKVFDKQKDELKSIFDKNERARFMDFFRPMTNAGIMATIKDIYGCTMTIPEGYYIATNNDYFTWLRKEELDKSLGLIIYQLPYKSTDDFSEKRLIRTCDSVTKKYIPGPSDGSYMTLDKEFITPEFNVVSDFPATYAVEMRGLWKMENDFMAGPYVAYTFVNPQNDRITTALGYVYYPNKPKRDLLRQLETIIWSLKF